MAGFNPLLIISRITSNVVSAVNIQNSASSSAQNTSSNLGAGFNTFSSNFQSQGQNSGNSGLYFTPTPLILTPGAEMKLTTIEVDKKAQYIRSLLNLPESFEDFTKEITSLDFSKNLQNQPALENVFQKLFQAGKIDLLSLSMLLRENSKEAMQKLMMIIANVSKYGANDISGLKEMMNLFNSQTAFASENQALKTLILLYLPWLPLSQRSENGLDFTIDIFDKIQGPDPDSKENTEEVKILIETKNFSNVTVTLNMNPIGQIDIDVIAGNDFPHKKVMELIKEKTSINNVKANISSGASKQINADEKINYSSDNVKITSSGQISPKMMLMAQCLIKIIIEVDYQKSIIIDNNECSNETDDEPSKESDNGKTQN